MARIEDIERRLLNWARWKEGEGSGGLGYAKADLMAAGADRGGYRTAVIPTDNCEAQETDAGIMALPSEIRATVELVYVGGGSGRDCARRLACAESTMYARVDRAHYLLSAWLSERSRVKRDQVERMAVMAQSARPRDDAGSFPQ